MLKRTLRPPDAHDSFNSDALVTMEISTAGELEPQSIVPPQQQQQEQQQTMDSGALCEHDLECAVCMSLLVEPVTLPCGHSLCRLCLVRTLQRVNKCPTCRAVCHVSPEDHPETVVITRLARRHFPALYEARLEEVRQERESMRLLLPAFFYNLPMFPGELLGLHLFEPRYKMMMQRIVNSTRRFAYVPNYSTYRASVGDVALIAELREVHFLSDGRSELEAKLSAARYRIVEHYVEEGTGGLSYCKIEEMRDDPTPPGKQAELEAEAAKARGVAGRLFLEHSAVKRSVVHRFGDIPSRGHEALSLWITGVLPMENRQEKHEMLVMTNTLERLRICNAHLACLEQTLCAQWL